jgi:hypothetical protein
MLASEAEARRREAWAGAQRGQLAFPRPRDAWAVRIVLGFHLYKYLCKPQEISISIVNLLRSVTTQNSEIAGRRPWFFPLHFGGVFHVKSVSSL